MTVLESQESTWPEPLPLAFSRPHVFLVEGLTDQSLVGKLAEVLNLELDDIHVHAMGGKDTDWRSFLHDISQDFAFQDNVRSIGLIRDADQDANAAFASCRNALSKAELALPDAPGDVVSDGRVKTGIFIVPGQSRPGFVEHLLVESIPAIRRDLADSYLQAVRDVPLDAPSDNPKHLIEAFMAGTRRSPSSMRVGLLSGVVFDLSSPTFAELSRFVRELCS
jgi:hypothetical protein